MKRGNPDRNNAGQSSDVLLYDPNIIPSDHSYILECYGTIEALVMEIAERGGAF